MCANGKYVYWRAYVDANSEQQFEKWHKIAKFAIEILTQNLELNNIVTMKVNDTNVRSERRNSIEMEVYDTEEGKYKFSFNRYFRFNWMYYVCYRWEV